MHGERKVYVIDPEISKGRTAERSAERAGGGGAARARGGSAGKEPDYLGPSRGRAGRQSGSSRGRGGEPGSGTLLLLSWLAGPFSVLSARGRVGSRAVLWSSLCAAAVLSGAALAWRMPTLWSRDAGPAGLIVVVAGVAAVLVWTMAWSRAALILGKHESARLGRAPGWLRGRSAAGLLGMISPGMGLFAAGRPRLAAAAVWTLCAVAAPALLLSKAGWLWDFNARAGALSMRPDALEYVFIAAAAMGILGAFLWIAQALGGIRHAPVAGRRGKGPAGDRVALALLISVLCFPFLSRPEVIAGALGRGAELAVREGMNVIPLHLSLAAARLDPSRPGHLLRAIGLYEGSGDRYSADRLRRELASRLEEAIPLLEEEGLIASGAGGSGGRQGNGEPAQAGPIQGEGSSRGRSGPPELSLTVAFMSPGGIVFPVQGTASASPRVGPVAAGGTEQQGEDHGAGGQPGGGPEGQAQPDTVGDGPGDQDHQ